MVAYHQFVELSQSGDSEARGQAAHLAARAYLAHSGPADEHAALYAALIGFLDDPSVKVRAALAYGLLHAPGAPRPVLLALLQDAEIIARAVAQYSPALLDADLIATIRQAEPAVLAAIGLRTSISPRVAEALVARDRPDVTLALARRTDIAFGDALLLRLAERGRSDAKLRGALLERRDLPAAGRLSLVEAAIGALRQARVVKGAIQPRRLERLLRNAADTAMSAIGEREAAGAKPAFAAELVSADRVSTRVMLHAIVTGHVLFFADCIAELSGIGSEKVFSLLENGAAPALNALLLRCGLGEGVRRMVVHLIFHARDADLADDAAARHYVVTALTEELIAEYDGAIPPELEEAFAYLCEQNVALARKAARGVMAAFADASRTPMPVALFEPEPQLALAAA